VKDSNDPAPERFFGSPQHLEKSCNRNAIAEMMIDTHLASLFRRKPTFTLGTRTFLLNASDQGQTDVGDRYHPFRLDHFHE
jgi:hypothetical protein